MTEGKQDALKQGFSTAIVALIVSLITTGVLSWGMLQRHDERIGTLERSEAVRQTADDHRDKKIDDMQRVMIRVDERAVGIDTRLQRMERAMDRERRQP
jgi:hypothetical protein